MPNFDELQTAISNVGEVQLKGSIYWSSTEVGKYGAWIVNIGDGGIRNYAKDSGRYYVRAFLAL